MPINTCRSDGKPGYKYGNSGKCYTYTPNDDASKLAAKKKAIKQGLVIEGPEKFKREMSKSDIDIYREIVEDETSTEQERATAYQLYLECLPREAALRHEVWKGLPKNT